MSQRSRVRPSEYEALSAAYGPSVRRQYDLSVSAQSLDEWRAKSQKNRAEVGMAILRDADRILLHTKSFYPSGAFRIPTGGIPWDEEVLHALSRELYEETGLEPEIVRFLALAEYRFLRGSEAVSWATFLFLVRPTAGKLQLHDEHERITEFREVGFSDLNRVADELSGLPGRWGDWGRFRAIAHRLTAELAPSALA